MAFIRAASRAGGMLLRRRRIQNPKSKIQNPAGRGRFYGEHRGMHRVFAAAGYRFYRTLGSPPAEGDTPFATNATLPHTPASTFGNGAWYISVSYYNGVLDSGFLPIGAAGETYLRLDIAGGSEIAGPPAAPFDVRLEQRAGGVVAVLALYAEGGVNRGDLWAIGYESGAAPADPAEDAPDVTLAIADGGLAMLEYELPAASDGHTVKVRVQVKRSSDNAFSDGSAVLSIVADATGPTAPLMAERWAGVLPQE